VHIEARIRTYSVFSFVGYTLEEFDLPAIKSKQKQLGIHTSLGGEGNNAMHVCYAVRVKGLSFLAVISWTAGGGYSYSETGQTLGLARSNLRLAALTAEAAC
jgi:hypothetical protein